MIVALCIDDKNGMTFFGKRQSRDRYLIKDFMSLCEGTAIIAPYSAALFEEYDVVIDNNLLLNASEGEYCFVENKNILPYSGRIEKLIIYKWNRRYPSDRKFIMPAGFELEESYDFEGFSHENITREIYLRRENADEKEKKKEKR